MKKKKLILTSVVTISAAAGWNFSQNRSETALSDVALANVEHWPAKIPIAIIVMVTGVLAEVTEEHMTAVRSGEVVLHQVIAINLFYN
jgi:hypothetical protein